MTSKSKKILISTRTFESIVFREIPKPTDGDCLQCGQRRAMTNLDSAVAISGLGALELVGRITSRRLHAIEAEYGGLLICLHSLEKQ